jgi:hypothetical protein
MWRVASRISVAAITLVAVGVMAAPAAGCPEIRPGVCQETGKVNLPANSYGSQSTDTVPTFAYVADVTVTPDAPPDKPGFDSLWLTIVDSQPKLAGIKNKTVQRFITCQLLSQALTSQKLDEMSVTVHARTFNNAAAATFFVCLALAFSEPPASAGRAAASPPCGAPVGVPIQISRSGSTYTVGAQGRTFKPRRPPLAVSCRRRGSALVISLRSRRRGRKLSGLLGPHLTIGFANHSSRAVHLRTTYRFSK